MRCVKRNAAGAQCLYIAVYGVLCPKHHLQIKRLAESVERTTDTYLLTLAMVGRACEELA